MSQRNFTLLIIILIISATTVFGFLYFRPQTTPSGDSDQGINFISRFNPFSNNKTIIPKTESPVVDISGTLPPPAEEIPIVKLKRISGMPVAGFGLFMKERLKDINPTPTLPLSGEGDNLVPPAKGGSGGLKPTPPPTEFITAVRYVERATGNIYQTFLDKIEERKFSTTVIPKVHEAYFGNKGKSVIMRYLKIDDRTIETFVGTLPKELLGGDTTLNNEIKGSFLPDNITDASVSPDATKIFYLFNVGDNMVGTIFNLLDNKKIQIFDSLFTEWLSFWPNGSLITLTTKPSWNTKGYMYGLNPSAKSFNRILGDINGLTTLTSPNGKLVLYGNNNLSLSVYNISAKNSDLLGVRTLPEKCVWGKLSDIVYCAVPKSINETEYPDAWYQGEVSFSDQIWRIDIKNGNTTMISDPVTILGGEDIDGIKLTLDESEKYLLFVNKKDSFLWELKLE